MQPGECFYMYTHERCASLAPYQVRVRVRVRVTLTLTLALTRCASLAPYQLPEMHRTPLHELCLQIKLLELGEIEDFLAKARAPTRTRATLTMGHT